MRSLFIDTSALACVLFREPRFPEILDILSDCEKVRASSLLEAEIRSAAAREAVSQQEVDGVVRHLEWVLPDRPLSQELSRVLSAGVPLRGADAWHLACALYLAGDPSNLPFVTLDDDQAEAARLLGFRVLPGAAAEAREARAAYRTGTSAKPEVGPSTRPRARRRRGKRGRAGKAEKGK